MAQTSLAYEGDMSLFGLFRAFAPCIHSYKSHFSKIIIVEGHHLTGKYFYTLVMTCACDTQKHISSISYAVVDSKIKDNLGSLFRCGTRYHYCTDRWDL